MTTLILRAMALLLAVAGAAQAQTSETQTSQTQTSQTPTPLKFTLNFRLESSNAAFFLAEDRGYYAAEGLKVTLDGARGSADAASRVASGTYQMGFVDINVITEFNARTPDRALQSVFMIYDITPMAIASLKKRGIATLDDLAGRTVGVAAGDGAYRMFPAFAKLNKLDAGKIKFQQVESQLRETMLLRGDVDAVIGYDYTIWTSLRAGGETEASTVFLRYSDHGMRLYGNSIAASRAFIDANPDVVRRFVAAAARAWRDTMEKPADAIESLLKRDPLLNRDSETERMRWMVEHNLRPRDEARKGLGDVDPKRLADGLAVVSQALELPTTPSVDSVFTDRFLPPLPDRTPKL